MNRRHRLLIGLLAAMLCIQSASASTSRTKLRKLPSFLTGPRPETGSFLNHVANTLPEVIGQVKGDSDVADRLMRHFHMSREELVRYLGTLHQTTLKAPGVYLVYNVHDDGVLRARAFNLPAGMPVYANAAGMPILRHKCANPMALGPNRGALGESTAIATEESQLVALADDPSTEEIIAEVAPQEPQAPIPMSEMAPTVPVTAPEIIKVDPPQIMSTSGNPFDIIVMGLSVGGSLIVGSQGTTTSPVPEPASVLALGIPIAALALRKVRRRSR